MQQTISAEPLLNLIGTNVVSNPHFLVLDSSLVKNLLIGGNVQVTNMFNSLVGTSETIRLLSINFYTINYFNVLLPFSLHPSHSRHSRHSISTSSPKDQAWYEWLAGLIDGDGCFLLSKAGYGSFEITMGLKDEHCLNQIKQRYGGALK